MRLCEHQPSHEETAVRDEAKVRAFVLEEDYIRHDMNRSRKSPMLSRDP